jgi:hypothetical protein
MSLPPSIVRIRAEDFPEENQEMISKLAYPINRMFEQIIALFNKQIDFQNLNRQIISIDVKTDASNNVIGVPQAKFSLRDNQIQGVNIIKAINNNDPTVSPTSHPFITFTYKDGIISISKITGLQINSYYTLIVEVIGT